MPTLKRSKTLMVMPAPPRTWDPAADGRTD